MFQEIVLSKIGLGRINKIEHIEMQATGDVVETLYIVRVDGQSSVCVCLPRASLRFVFAFSLCCGQRGGRVCIAVCGCSQWDEDP